MLSGQRSKCSEALHNPMVYNMLVYRNLPTSDCTGRTSWKFLFASFLFLAKTSVLIILLFDSELQPSISYRCLSIVALIPCLFYSLVASFCVSGVWPMLTSTCALFI